MHGSDLLDRPLDDAVGKARPTHVRYWVAATAGLLAVIAYVHRMAFAWALPQMGLSKVEASWLGALFQVTYGAFEVPGGMLVDRCGSRHVLTILVIAWSLATAAVAVAAGLPAAWVFPFLLLARGLFGVCQAGAFPGLSRMLTDWLPRQERASAQGGLWMATRLGAIVILPCLGVLSYLVGGWQLPLVLASLVGFAWAAAFWPWFRDRPEKMPSVGPVECATILAGRTNRSSGHGPVPWSLILRSRSVWCLCLMYCGSGFAANFYVTLLPTYLHDERQLDASAVAWLSGLPFACGMAGCILGGLISDGIIRRTGRRNLGRRLTGLVGFTVGAAAWLFVPQVQDVWLLGAVLGLIFFCNDLNMAPAWAACSDVGERYAGTVGGAMNMAASFAGALGNLTYGFLIGRDLDGLVFGLYACSFGLGALSWLGVDVTRPLASEPPPGDAHANQSV